MTHVDHPVVLDSLEAKRSDCVGEGSDAVGHNLNFLGRQLAIC